MSQVHVILSPLWFSAGEGPAQLAFGFNKMLTNFE
jgi:hypothetical protein